jgi:hypothetical protein
MNALTCTQARARYTHALRAGEPIAPEVSNHFAECPTCRTALLLMEALALTHVPDEIDCARCREMLLAFVERERADGSIAAIRAYPQIWWHLWACRECLGVYDQANGSRPPVPAPRPLTLLHLPRQYLAQAIPAPATMRGGYEGPFLVAEGSAEPDRHVSLFVEQQRDTTWTVTVTVAPAPAGGLVLMLGSEAFRARFDATGTAVVVGVPAERLGGADGPDMVASIEPDS